MAASLSSILVMESKRVFGAPLDDPTHALNAVRTALLCRERLEQLNNTSHRFAHHRLSHRIGLNSGDALVGNIGSPQHFTYTGIGDTVNLASRIEGANKYFATSIMATEMTVALTGSAIVWRELDSVRVKGRSQIVNVYEPIAEAGHATTEQLARAAVYTEGLARWRARDFSGAAERFASIADIDPSAALFLERAKALILCPPAPEWEPVYTLEAK